MVDAAVEPKKPGPPVALKKDTCIGPSPVKVRGWGTQTEKGKGEHCSPSAIKEKGTRPALKGNASPLGMRRGGDVAGGTPVTSVGGSSPARPSYATVAAGVSSPGPWGAGLEIRSPDLGEVRIGRCDSGDLLVEFPGVNNVERGNIRAAAVSPGGSPSFGGYSSGGGR